MCKPYRCFRCEALRTVVSGRILLGLHVVSSTGSVGRFAFLGDLAGERGTTAFVVSLGIAYAVLLVVTAECWIGGPLRTGSSRVCLRHLFPLVGPYRGSARAAICKPRMVST